jgi:hypothetical protein
MSLLPFEPSYDVGEDRGSVDIVQMMVAALDGPMLRHRLQFLVQQLAVL